MTEKSLKTVIFKLLSIHEHLFSHFKVIFSDFYITHTVGVHIQSLLTSHTAPVTAGGHILTTIVIDYVSDENIDICMPIPKIFIAEISKMRSMFNLNDSLRCQ